jgi:hypothetical protein
VSSPHVRLRVVGDEARRIAINIARRTTWELNATEREVRVVKMTLRSEPSGASAPRRRRRGG